MSKKIFIILIKYLIFSKDIFYALSICDNVLIIVQSKCQNFHGLHIIGEIF